MTNRIIVAAVLLAMLVTLSVSLGVSAASPSAGSVQIKGQALTVKYLGKVNFSDAIAKSVSHSSGDATAQLVHRSFPKGARAFASLPMPIVPGSPISGAAMGAKVAKGLNSYDNRYTNGFNVTPPDQGLCVGAGFVVETVNDVMAIYNTNLARISADATLNNFYGVVTSRNLSDPRCYFDPDTQRFFMTVVDYATPTATFVGDSFIDVAVSTTSDPRLSWLIYQLDTTFATDRGGAALADYPLLGANRDAIIVSVNMFPWAGGFNGAYIFAFDKMGMVAGVAPVNAAVLKPGLTDTPDGPCPPEGAPCWYGVQPASSPAVTSWDNRFGGTEYFLSSLDFFGTTIPDGDRPAFTGGDDRIATWALTNTQSIRGIPNLAITWKVVKSEVYGMPPNGAQKDDGILDAMNFYYCPGGVCPGIGPIASNDDEMRQTVYANRTLWGELGTGLTEPYKPAETHAGIAWFAVTPKWNARGDFVPSMLMQGYLAAAHADMVFPSIGMTQAGRGVMAFSVTSAKMYPSGGLVYLGNGYGPGSINVYAKGMGSLDDFCGYPAANCGGTGVARPRFGDYSAAFAWGNNVYIADEYVQSPECPEAIFALDHTCGGTRGNRTNWGTSLGKISP